MPWYTCTVNKAGPAADARETSAPVVYINLTDNAGAFANMWFYAADGDQNQMLAVALAAINGGKRVEVNATPPNSENDPITPITRFYINV